MKLKLSGFLAGSIVGAVIGACGIGSLLAQPARPPAYLVVNTDKYVVEPILYHRIVAAAVLGFKGRILVEDAKPEAVDTSEPPAGSVTLIAFDSMDDLKNFRDSSHYQGALRSIEATSKIKHYAIEGRLPEAGNTLGMRTR